MSPLKDSTLPDDISPEKVRIDTGGQCAGPVFNFIRSSEYSRSDKRIAKLAGYVYGQYRISLTRVVTQINTTNYTSV